MGNLTTKIKLRRQGEREGLGFKKEGNLLAFAGIVRYSSENAPNVGIVGWERMRGHVGGG